MEEEGERENKFSDMTKKQKVSHPTVDISPSGNHFFLIISVLTLSIEKLPDASASLFAVNPV
jgi:hypothetical protein